MAIHESPAVNAQAQLHVLVGRDGPGDLVDAVQRLLERAPGVETADDLDVRNVQPGLNDVRLDVEAELRVHPDEPDEEFEPDDLEAQLVEGFGVREVTITRLGPPDR